MADYPSWVPTDTGGAHALLSPSASHRWMKCPASLKLSAMMPNRDSEAAAEGTAVHMVAEAILKGEAEGWEFIGQTNSPEITSEMVDNAQAFASLCEANSEGASMKASEFRVSGLHPLMFGTVDFLAVRGEQIVVMDYKNGLVQVEAEDNPQLMLYASMAVEELGLWDTIKWVKMAIVQRRPGAPGEPSVKEWEVTADDLGAWCGSVLSPAIDAALVEEPLAAPDAEHQCKYCPAKLVCPAYADMVGEAVDDVGAIEREFERAERQPAYDYGPLLARIHGLKKFMAQIEELAKTELLNGHTVSGYKLVKGRSTREWNEGAEEAIRTEYGPEAYVTKLKSPAQIEKMVHGKAMAQEWAYSKAGGPTLVNDQDPRAALTMKDAEGMFGSTT